MRNSVLRFTDSWGLTWWVFEAHGARPASTDEHAEVRPGQSRLCFSTDMMTRVLESYPAGWWWLADTRLEAMCASATPSLVHHMPPAAAAALTVTRTIPFVPAGRFERLGPAEIADGGVARYGDDRHA